MRRSKDSIRCCIVDERAIFMDIAHNRYFALAPQRDRIFRAFASGTFSESDDEGLIDLANSVAPLSTGIPEAIADYQEDKAATNLVWIVWVTFILAVAKLVVKFVALDRIVDHFELSRDQNVAERVPRLWCARTCAAFRDAELIFRREDNCLPRSLAFLWLCHRSGYRPKLIIGVRIHPFAAHSWVQDDDAVLNDSKDNVRPYKPILAL